MAGLTKVFVGNLSFTTKEPELASEFAAAGKVVNANIITRGPRSLGYGFVEFATEQEAQNAVKVMDKKEVQGRQVNVELARPQDEIKKKEEQEPKTRGSSRGGRGGLRGRGGRGGRGRRTFRRRDQGGEDNNETSSPQQSGKSEKQPTNNNNNDEKKEKKPRQPREKRVNENREESKTTLFVANLPFSLDDAAFGKFITDLTLKFKTAHVVTKRNGRSKGYGFVEFDTHEDQQKALQAIDKKEVDGRALSVKVALTEPKTEEKDEKKDEKKEEKKEPVKKDEKPVVKETKKEEKKEPAQKETKKEEKKEAAKSPQAEKKVENKPAAKETKSPQPQKK